MTNNALQKIKQYGLYITGFTEGMRLEHRMFNMMCVIAALLVACSIPFALLIGLQITAFLLTFVFVALGLVYYLARFRKQFNLSIIFVSSFVPIVLSINFFYSGGIWGTTLPAIVITFFLIMIVIPRKISWMLAFFCLTCCFCLIWTEFHYPQMVGSSYNHMSSRFIDTSYNTIISVLVIFAGITTLKNAYYAEKIRADKRARELEQMNEEKNKLFSIISHDLRAPLASIQNYLYLLKSFDLSSEERLSAEQKLSDTVNGTQEMLDNLLHWSRSQIEKITTPLTCNNISEVLTPLMILQRTAAMEKGIQFEWSFAPELSAWSDSNMLQLILRNLTSNAIKFTTTGGMISVKAEPVDNQCFISVTDNGKGISAADKEKIFSLNGRSTYGTANEKGIGLGLYLCSEYTAIQNGKIWHESNEANGSTFCLTLGLAKIFSE